MKGKDARGVAIDALTAYRKRGARIEGYLKNEIAKNELSSRDGALATEIANGVMQNMLYLDHCISCFSSVKLNRIAPGILDIMRVAVYQMLFLDRVPDSAAVHDAVSRAKKDNYRAAGFVNAVLRKISSNKGQIPEVAGDREHVLSVKYSVSPHIVRELIAEYGEDVCEDFLKGSNEKVPTVLRVNTLNTNRDSLLSALSDDGIFAEHDIIDNSLRVSHIGNLGAIDSFRTGKFYVQDTASQLAALALAPKPKSRVLDACAAPGGKSFCMAIEMKNEGEILSCDIFEHRLNLIKEGAARLGIEIIKTEKRDAAKYDENLTEKFDYILADVPCSGIGIIRRKPDIRYKKREDLAELPSIQLDILKNTSRYLKRGGYILYSTCTVLSRENSDVVRSFLEDNDEFEEVRGDYPNIPAVNNEFGVTFLPNISGTDGFYMCKLRRKND